MIRYRRLLTERAKFARAIELAPDGILIVDSARSIVLANPAMLRLLGAPFEVLLGQPLASLVVPEQRDDCQRRLLAVLADPAAVERFEAVLIHLEGRHLPVELHGGFFAWDGQPAVQIIVMDMSERKRPNCSKRSATRSPMIYMTSWRRS